MDLTLRARKILSAVVQEYLSTGDAVGSRTITRRYHIDLSPATVRNVMSDLEELGLLKQPHTSAGRVPTNTGLRFFIDSLLKVRSLSVKEKDDIRARYSLPSTGDLDDVLQRTSRILSDLAQHAAIVVTPGPERQRLQHLEFVQLSGTKLLAVLVSEGGQVENKLLEAPVADLEKVNNYLNNLARGRTLEEARLRVLEELASEKAQVDDMTAEALQLGRAVFSADAPDVIVSGQAHLVDARGATEPADLERTRLRALLVALEEKERIVQLLDRTLDADGIQVWLGAETPFASVGDLSVIATPYGPEDRPVGTIAVIGPTRMNYSRVIPLVDFTAELVSGALASKR
jgi:heat-inducible transcriptional repressor